MARDANKRKAQGIGFDDALLLAIKKAFDYKGRSSRPEFWYWIVFAAAGAIALFLPTLISGMLATGALVVQTNYDELAVVEKAEEEGEKGAEQAPDAAQGEDEPGKKDDNAKQTKRLRRSPKTILLQFGETKKQAQICAFVFLTFFTVFLIFEILVFIPTLSTTVRRLHDIGASGWNIFWALTGIGAAALAVAACVPSTTGENKYGEQPK